MEIDLSQATLLLVDDNKENLKVLGSILRHFGFKMAFAGSGRDAIDIVESTAIDLILLDIMMPEMDGYETCKHIKAIKKYRDIPIIFLTAKTETEDIVTAFEVGGVDYVVKPFRKEELICRINTHLELKFAREILKQQAKDYKLIARDAISSIDKYRDDPYSTVRNEK